MRYFNAAHAEVNLPAAPTLGSPETDPRVTAAPTTFDGGPTADVFEAVVAHVVNR